MLHHHPDFIQSAQADRLAARKRLPAHAAALERRLSAASRGYAAAWASLTQRFAARLRAVVRAHRLTSHDAEDVIQTTWFRLFEHIDSVREPAAIGAWLETTARRESLRVIRAACRERPTDHEQLTPDPVAAVAEERLLASQNRAAVTRALAKLPNDRR